MTGQRVLAPVPDNKTYISHLWEYPDLTLAIFGMQVHSPESYALYQEAGIPAQMEESLKTAEGLLCVRDFEEGSGGLQLQYWRSHDDLERFARQMPHTQWWKWLTENRGKGFTFYHEVYQCKTAEAIFEVGAIPVGPATFCTNTAVESGEGRSKERQRRFEDAVKEK